MLRKALLFFLLVLLSNSAYAADKPGFKFRTDLRLQMLYEDNVDFGSTNNDSSASQSIELRERITWIPTDNLKLYLEGRAVKLHGEGGNVDLDNGTTAVMEDFLEWRQSWIEVSDLFGSDPLSVKIGRQRFKEDRSLWWNRDFDAMRLSYDKDHLRGFVGIGQNLASYRTSQDDFEEEDRDILRILSEISWDYMTNHTLEFRSAWQNDRSGMENIGSLIRTNDRDIEDEDVIWVGTRFTGNVENIANYSIDLMGVTGQVSNQTSTITANPALRTVTGSTKRDVLGWGLDAALHAPISGSNVAAILGYAFGSGDGNAATGTDRSFRQIDLRSNYSRQGLFDSSMSHYGSVLRPELTNLHIFTAGLSAPLFQDSNITGLYHYYRLDEGNGRIGTTGISSPLTAGKTDLGHAIDVMLNVNLTKELGLSTGFFDRVEFRTNVGVFRAGDAYGAEDGEYTLRGVSELRFRF